MTATFALDPQLAADSVELASWPFCLVRLMDEARFPWLILVPARPGLREIHDLPAPDRGTLIEEIARAGRLMQAAFAAEKINTAALGNQVCRSCMSMSSPASPPMAPGRSRSGPPARAAR
jgi:diadenosine tetraphosphate (Ap4A) HIT family hydrolase